MLVIPIKEHPRVVVVVIVPVVDDPDVCWCCGCCVLLLFLYARMTLTYSVNVPWVAYEKCGDPSG